MITARAVPALPAHYCHALESSIIPQDFADPLGQLLVSYGLASQPLGLMIN
jgi:hypothetical protein